MLVEIHMLQNHAPSNLNRDDTGSPKDCHFGGALRARISSQCLKRSIRRSPIFTQRLDGHLATRTRRMPHQLRQALLELGCAPDSVELIVRRATEFGSGKQSTTDVTRQLIFLGPDDVAQLAHGLKVKLDEIGPKKFADLKHDELARITVSHLPRSVDIALFGRMTTSAAFEDVQASLQVAHALSTGRVEKQYDYYTAVDDLVETGTDPDDQGAGMIGDIEFNSATYYKYFSLDWDEFVRNLSGDTETARRALEAFLFAASLTTPSGKQNAFAANNPPDAILVEIKSERLPVSYANAFVEPVRAGGGQDIMARSIDALSSYSVSLKTAYGLTPTETISLTVRGETIAGSRRVETLPALVAATIAAVDNAGQVGDGT